ncbi:MAG: lipopolysaccharide heptosyltransferase I [Wolinella sp.]
MKLAIVKLSALGDIVHFALFLPELRARVSDLHITWFVDERFAGLLVDSPLVDKVCSLPLKKAWQLRSFCAFKTIVKNLKSHGEFDLVIDSQGLLKSAIIARLIPAKTRVGFDFCSAKERLSALFYDKKVSISYNEHILARNKKLLDNAFNIELDWLCGAIYREESNSKTSFQSKESSVDYLSKERIKSSKIAPFGYTKEALNRVDSLLFGKNRKKILFVLEASKKSKVYPAARFLELAKICRDSDIFLLWYTDEASADFIKNGESSVTKLPRLSLDEVKALVFRVDVVVGGDTGVTHLAFTFGTPSVTLFGNTPIERFALCGARHRVLRASGAKMYDKDDLSIETILPSEILHSIEEIL